MPKNQVIIIKSGGGNWKGQGVEGRGGVLMICPSLKNIEISITYIVSRETGYETLQVLKAIKKTQQFMFKVLQPCTLWLNNLTLTFLLVSC